MTIYGITAAGFVLKPLLDIKSDLEAALKAEFGNEIDLSSNEPFGQLVGIFAERFSELWQLEEAVYKSEYPDSATGTSLDEVCGITGTIRDPAEKSTASVVAIGTNGTVLASGRVFSVVNNNTRFDSQASATIATLTARATATPYALGDLCTNGGNVYCCIVAGTSSGGGGPTTTSLDITDGSVHWRYLGAGTAAVRVAVVAEEYGPLVAPAGTLTVIQTPVAGLASVTNPLDATLGADVELDSSLRIRREQELRAEGNAQAEAIRSKILKVPGVVSCTVFENDTDATDGDGLPPHSIEVLVWGGTDAAIRAAIWASKAAGIATYGSTSGTITDTSGVVHTIKFSRPTPETVWVIVHVTKEAAGFPSDGVAQIKQALVDYSLGLLLDDAGRQVGPGYAVGDDVVQSKLYIPVESISGIYDVTEIFIGLSDPPTSAANLVLTLRQLAVFDTSRITVAVV